MAKAIRDGFHAITPSLVVKGAAEAIEFYKRAFGAEEVDRTEIPSKDGGTVICHAELQIGDSRLMLCDEFPEHGALGPRGHTSVSIFLYVEDVDAVYARAVEAGAVPEMPPADMFWGDRWGKLADPFGHQWSIATHFEDVPREHIRERMANAMAAGACSDAAVEA